MSRSSSCRFGEHFGACKVLNDNAGDVLTGAYPVRPNGAETINLLVPAMKYMVP